MFLLDFNLSKVYLAKLWDFTRLGAISSRDYRAVAAMYPACLVAPPMYFL